MLFKFMNFLIYFQVLLAQDFWEQTNGPIGVGIFALAINSYGDIYAGTHSGVFRSPDNGENWIQVGLLDTLIHTLAINSGGDVFVGTYDGVYCSTNNGASWFHVFAGSTYSYVQSLAINDNGHIFAATFGCSGTWCSGGIYRSKDNGDNWEETGLIGPLIASLVIDVDGVIFAGNPGGFESAGFGVYRSIDEGDSWVQVNNGLEPNAVYALSTSIQGDMYAGTYDGVYRSEDKGDNWTQRNLKEINVSSLTTNISGDVFAGTGESVFRSTDYGENWMNISSGLPDSGVLCLEVNSEGYLFAGTLRGGVFRSLEPTVSFATEIVSIPGSFVLPQPYPNPFNPTITIEFSIPQSGIVALSVYDVLGRQVEIILNKHMQAGHHKVQWNASDIASGIYFIRMQSSDFSQTRKVVVLP